MILRELIPLVPSFLIVMELRSQTAPLPLVFLAFLLALEALVGASAEALAGLLRSLFLVGVSSRGVTAFLVGVPGEASDLHCFF